MTDSESAFKAHQACKSLLHLLKNNRIVRLVRGGTLALECDNAVAVNVLLCALRQYLV